MKSVAGVLGYVRSLLGWSDEDQAIRPSFKRDRTDDDLSSDDDTPAQKRLKQLRRTNFPDVMATNDIWEEEKKPKNVRIVPIQLDAGHPSTSTPNEVSGKPGRLRSVQYVGVKENGQSIPARKPRMHTPVRPVVHTVLDDDEDEPEVTWVQSKPRTKKPSKVYIDLDDDENDANLNNDEVIFVRKVTTPPAVKPYKFFISKNNNDEPDSRDNEQKNIYYRLERRNERSESPKSYRKFIAPPGISKSYKKAPTPLPRWMESQKINNLSNIRSRYLGLNGNGRSTLSEVFNLDEKRNYQELIKKVMETAKPTSLTRRKEIMNIAEDAAAFRMTQRSQRQALNDIMFAEKGLIADKLNETTKEYDPITVASINSSDSEIEVVPSESSSSSTRINPVNSLRDANKDYAITSQNYLSILDSKYKKKRQETQAQLHDARRESDIISKINYEQKLALLEHKLKHELSIPESLIEEPQPTVELPKLTPEQEKVINKVLGMGPPGQLLVEKFNLRIHRRDLQTLAGLNWLNDEVINFYMNLLMQRSQERDDLPQVYAANTFFYPKLMQSGQAGLRRWTRKVDIFAHDLMVVPVHLGVHWCLSLVDFRERTVSYLDSMGGRNQPCLDALVQYLRDEHQDKKGQPFDDSGWKTQCLSKDIPQQMNGSDCGMFACTFAEFSCRGAPYTFTQGHMPYLRRKMALEILVGKLLL